MLKSRRGLLAAGLAVAVVGAIGIASTVNAGADQIASPPEASSAPADADAPDTAPATAADDLAEVAPPPRLPWGALPADVEMGPDGASSSTLKARGLSAAAPDTSDSLVPDPVFGPKGRSSKTSVLKSELTDVVPPKPLGVKAEENEVKYLYNVGSQTSDSTGVYANVTIGKPELDDRDYHTLAELALQSADGKQIVEVGWTVDRVVNGDSDPHLFVFHWVNGEPACYNGCGWLQASENIKPGSTLAYGVTKKFGIEYYKDGWWVAYDSEWIGYFPEKLWNDKGVKFNRSGFVQVFGEVAAATTTPCTDMGNGVTAIKDTSARVSSVSFLDGPAVDMYMRSTAPLVYPVSPVTARSFRYGGPGAC